MKLYFHICVRKIQRKIPQIIHVCQGLCHFSQAFISLFTHLGIYFLHPFVRIHIVGCAAQLMILVVMSIHYKMPFSALPGISSENMFVEITTIVINKDHLVGFDFFWKPFKNGFCKQSRIPLHKKKRMNCRLL